VRAAPPSDIAFKMSRRTFRQGFVLAVFAQITLLSTRRTAEALTSVGPGRTTTFASPRLARITSLSMKVDDSIDLSQVQVPQVTDEEKEFLEKTAVLCQERNLPLEKVKNARDLASAHNSPILPGRVFRIGRVSDATENDLEVLFNQNQVKTLVDLRSPTELKDDPTLERPEVFSNFTDMVFYERGRMVKELRGEETRMNQKKRRDRVMEAVNGVPPLVLRFVDNYFGPEREIDDDDEEECIDCIEAAKLIEQSARRRDRKERHFVSIMNELKYVRGTLSKLRKRDVVKTIIKSPTTLVSKQARDDIKKPFLDEINSGGLPMLNELLLTFGAPGIKYVLDLISDKNRHPVAFYCTAGKDRTGVIAAVILSLLGAEDDAIVEDYSLSANVYAEMNDHKAMVGALSQRSLDAKTFLGAPPQVMRDTLANIRESYGSVEEYLDSIGFDAQCRDRLKYALTEE